MNRFGLGLMKGEHAYQVVIGDVAMMRLQKVAAATRTGELELVVRMAAAQLVESDGVKSPHVRALALVVRPVWRVSLAVRWAAGGPLPSRFVDEGEFERWLGGRFAARLEAAARELAA